MGVPPMTLDLSHLTAATRELAFHDAKARILLVQTARWVAYPSAGVAVEELERRFHYPTCARMPCMLLYGDSGMGKTMILEKMERQHPNSYEQRHLPHQLVVVRPDKKLGPALKLLRRFADVGQYQPINTPTEQVNPLHRISRLTGLNIERQSPKKSPMTSGHRSVKLIKISPQSCGQRQFDLSQRTVPMNNIKDHGRQIALLPNSNFAFAPCSGKHHGLVRWNRSAGQEQSDVETIDAISKIPVLLIKDVRIFGESLCQ